MMQATEALLSAAKTTWRCGDENSAANQRLMEKVRSQRLMEMSEALRSGADINAWEARVSHAKHMHLAHIEGWCRQAGVPCA